MPRKGAPKYCIYGVSSEKCRGREHPDVVFTGFGVESVEEERPNVVFTAYRVKSAEEGSTEMLYLRGFE